MSYLLGTLLLVALAVAGLLLSLCCAALVAWELWEDR